jgi:hypothetical protein
MKLPSLSKLAPLAPLLALADSSLSAAIDPRRAFAVAPSNLGPREKQAVQVLLDEVYARTRIRLPIESSWPSAPSQGIAIAPASSVRRLDANGRANTDAEVWLMLKAESAGGSR